MMTCKQFVKTVSLENPISLKQKLKLKFHSLICRHCRKYALHIKLLSLGIKKALSIKDKKIIQKVEDQIILRLQNNKHQE